VFIAVLRDFARGLDAGEPGAADDDLDGVRAGRLGGSRPDVLVDRLRVGEALELVGVLFESLDPKESGRGADA